MEMQCSILGIMVFKIQLNKTLILLDIGYTRKIGYQKTIYKNFFNRHMHNNGKLLKYQECCGAECDRELGKIIDYCLRGNDKIHFGKDKVVTDYQTCGGISRDHYPLYIEGYFM